MWAAIAAAIAGLFSNLMGSVLGYQSNRETNQANRDLAAQQNQWNVEQWQRQTAYNTPANQVARLAAANINPALAMANGGLVDAGNAGDVKGINPIPMQPYDPSSSFSSLSGQLMNLPLQQSQIKLQESQSNLQDASAKEILSKIPVNEQQALSFKKSVAEMDSRIDLNQQSIENLKSSKELADNQTIKVQLDGVLEQMRTFSQLLNDEADRSLKKSQRSKNYSDIKVNDQVIANGKKQCQLMTAQMFALAQNQSFVQAQVDEILQRVRAGDLALKEKYGSTPEAIEESLRTNHNALLLQAKTLEKRGEWTSTNFYRNMNAFSETFDAFYSPVERISEENRKNISTVADIIPTKGKKK